MARKLRTVRNCSCGRLGATCGAVTYNTWAPGHDAKAKRILQTAHREGEAVQFDGVWVSARQAAEELIPALVPFLYYRKGTLSARFADDAAAMADSAQSVQIKVGRWVYNGLLVGSQVMYATKAGDAKTVDVADAQFVA